MTLCLAPCDSRTQSIIKYNKQNRSYLVGAQFIGALPIHRPGEGYGGISGQSIDDGHYEFAPTKWPMSVIKVHNRVEARDQRYEHEARTGSGEYKR